MSGDWTRHRLASQVVAGTSGKSPALTEPVSRRAAVETVRKALLTAGASAPAPYIVYALTALDALEAGVFTTPERGSAEAT